ncbi:hypothetical protein SS37A_39730 (plasmid) [Methylocystis iwaonis]|uniref:Uncharacterized protein n=1 Tax=Methylocystis iwaonis TaxID=2885079 RepID=A0ABM8EEG8_9HYPH|nr:hypothetical protein SS37A_39730 [Methylocystis iwaonis]
MERREAGAGEDGGRDVGQAVERGEGGARPFRKAVCRQSVAARLICGGGGFFAETVSEWRKGGHGSGAANRRSRD